MTAVPAARPSTIVVTGSAGGIGEATRRRLERDGHTVIGVDVRDAEIVADLSSESGRADMVAAVEAVCGGALEGAVAGAGIISGGGRVGRGSGDDGDEDRLVVSVNLFGAIATLEGLRPLLARGTQPSAVAISSNSSTTQPGVPAAVIEACLSEDESRARDVAVAHPGSAYPASKLALARWVRRAAVTPAWAGSGIRLNAVAPGLIATPMTAGTEDFVLSLGDVYPVPQRRAGTAEEVAGLIAYLLSPDAAFFCGSVLFMDGGTDAAVRADDWPAPRPAGGV